MTTIQDMIRSLRLKNDRLAEQLENLVSSTPRSDLFLDKATAERGAEIARQIAGNTAFIEAAEQFLTVPEKRLLEHPEAIIPEPELPAGAKRFMDEIRGAVAAPVYDNDGCYCGSVYQRRNSTIRDHLIIRSSDTIASLFRIGYITDKRGDSGHDT